MKSFKRRTARAIVIKGDTILMFERWRRDVFGRTLHYFSIPGGGIELHETPEQAVVREMQEEMLVKVAPKKYIAVQESATRINHYFLCDILEGEPRFNTDSEEARFGSKQFNRYEAVWIDWRTASRSIRHKEYKTVLMKLPELLAAADSPVDITG